MIWKPCAESLPEDRSTVLIFNDAWTVEQIWVGFHDGNTWISAEGMWLDSPADSGKSNAAPTQWMPMPPPPVTGWSPELQVLSDLRPELLCNTFKYGRVVLQSGEHLVTLRLCPTANAAPLASVVLSAEEATLIAGQMAANAIKARARVQITKEGL